MASESIYVKNIEISPEVMKNVAIEAAIEAGKILMERIHRITLLGETDNNPTVQEDRDAERKILEILRQAFPDHAFLGEEFGESPADSPYKWIIDPIDGTNNYLEGRDTFSVSIALEKNNEMILGVVYPPKRDELFLAEKDKGATLNGNKIKTAEVSDIQEASVTYSVYPGTESQMKETTQRVLTSLPNVRFLSFAEGKVDPEFGKGSMAAEFCYLACGRLDGLIRPNQKPWDVAAGSLIAKEAGAQTFNLAGKEANVYEGTYVTASHTLIQELLKIINPG